MQQHPPDQIQHQVAKNDLIGKLSEILDKDAILYRDEELKPYECDGLSAYQQVPWLVVLPNTTGQVQQILRLCPDPGVH
ncbi:MAG: hypothetical protein BMS9Abin26_1644 [Gammaproteobacteria bacterium]|nr:MAG: hypothetical protein BMS9Abin26_1644 [Gammaproteobacteria bacterium]